MRKFLPEREQKEQKIERNLRTNDPAAIYARRSDPTAKDKRKDKSQSREMQTDDLLKWGDRQGWARARLFEYFADLGLSGTLRPDERPDMLRLFDDIDAGKFNNGTIICFQENRLFRDETQIYYNQFIDKCLHHNIHVVVISPRLTIYDLRDDLLKEMLRAKLKEAAEYIPRHIKGWLHPAKERAAWEYGEWAGMGGLPPGFIVDYDPESETYKKPVPYLPHLEKNREIFHLFMELGGNLGLLLNRLLQSPIVYPEFEPWVDRRTVSIFHLSKYPGGGYYMRSRDSLIKLLTHPLHYGYRPVKDVIRRTEQGEKIREFEPVIEVELLDFAYYRLAKTDFDGNPINESHSPRRYYQKDSTGHFGLLKYRIISTQGEVRTHRDGLYVEDTRSETGIYAITSFRQQDYLHRPVTTAAIDCEELDAIIVQRLMEHVRSISQKRESVETYQEQVDTLRKKRQSRIKQLEKSIQDIATEQKRLTARLGKQEDTDEKQEENQQKKTPSPRASELILEQIDVLEGERQTLLQTITALAEEATNDIGSLDEELEALETLWPEYDFQRRQTLINFAVREVVIDRMSTHWIRIHVLWLHEEWGREEMFYSQNKGRRKEWTPEEDEIIKHQYVLLPMADLMALLPDRTVQSIWLRGRHVAGSKREKDYQNHDTLPSWAKNFSYSDLRFMREHTIEGKISYTNWILLSPPHSFRTNA